MPDWLAALSSLNMVSAALVLILLLSVYEGARRGGKSSARQLAALALELGITAAAILGAWALAGWLSPWVQEWLLQRNIVIPNEELGYAKQLYYTALTGIRDFPLFRFAALFLVAYMLLKPILYGVLTGLFPLAGRWPADSGAPRSWSSLIAGGACGSLIGLWRSVIVVMALFAYTVMLPNHALTGYIQQSDLYRSGAERIVEPLAGEYITGKFPVLTQALETEYKKILQRKYEVVDARIPDNIAEAAAQVVQGAQTDEAKARALYAWVGTRIAYDWNKVEMYEKYNQWLEQTPEDTFRTRKGVCIDYARLYAVMARSVGLEVKVVTGLGYDGRGGYGPHAWNEVYLPEQQRWAPLDATWVSGGGNWFDPPDFDRTHIRDV